MRPIKRHYRYVRIGRLVPRLMSAIEIAALPKAHNRCRVCGCDYRSREHRERCLRGDYAVIADVDRRRRGQEVDAC